MQLNDATSDQVEKPPAIREAVRIAECPEPVTGK